MIRTFNRITIKVQAWWAKPLNISSGTSSFLMRGGEIPYQYQGKTNVKVLDLEEFLQLNKDLILDDFNTLHIKAKEKKPEAKIQVSILKEERGVSRVVKGVRGAIRHSIMNILFQREIEYCSSTTKERFKGTDNPTLLSGEHLMGKCGENPCPIRQLFGMLGEESPIRVWSDVIVQTDKPINNITKRKGISFVHVALETRHQARRDKKPLQNFSEQYFSGAFCFYIEFSKKLPNWLIGLLIEGILSVTHLGRGHNSGYGRLEVKEITLEKVSYQRILGQENSGSIEIIEKETTENQNYKLQESLDAWQKHN
ncbi:MAG: hypothetical protein HZR80_03575 [Candidatus Heimdallarchaeota archaeon]